MFIGLHLCSLDLIDFHLMSLGRVLKPKRSIGNVFTICIRIENQNQASFYSFGSNENLCSH